MNQRLFFYVPVGTSLMIAVMANCNADRKWVWFTQTAVGARCFRTAVVCTVILKVYERGRVFGRIPRAGFLCYETHHTLTRLCRRKACLQMEGGGGGGKSLLIHLHPIFFPSVHFKRKHGSIMVCGHLPTHFSLRDNPNLTTP